jgi:hypothetical protein
MAKHTFYLKSVMASLPVEKAREVIGKIKALTDQNKNIPPHLNIAEPLAKELIRLHGESTTFDIPEPQYFYPDLDFVQRWNYLWSGILPKTGRWLKSPKAY